MEKAELKKSFDEAIGTPNMREYEVSALYRIFDDANEEIHYWVETGQAGMNECYSTYSFILGALDYLHKTTAIDFATNEALCNLAFQICVPDESVKWW